jgi:hypothetical protein
LRWGFAWGVDEDEREGSAVVEQAAGQGGRALADLAEIQRHQDASGQVVQPVGDCEDRRRAGPGDLDRCLAMQGALECRILPKPEHDQGKVSGRGVLDDAFGGIAGAEAHGPVAGAIAAEGCFDGLAAVGAKGPRGVDGDDFGSDPAARRQGSRDPDHRSGGFALVSGDERWQWRLGGGNHDTFS